jgi:hypothetical protein
MLALEYILWRNGPSAPGAVVAKAGAAMIRDWTCAKTAGKAGPRGEANEN